MPEATFTRPDLTTFTRLDGLGLEVTGQLLESDRAVLACRVVEPDDWCRHRSATRRHQVVLPAALGPSTATITPTRYPPPAAAPTWDIRPHATWGENLDVAGPARC